MKLALGDKNPTPFSYSTDIFNPPNEPCFTTNSNSLSHDIIQGNLEKSPMFSGEIDGIGPRYCPSIEDKSIDSQTRISCFVSRTRVEKL